MNTLKSLLIGVLLTLPVLASNASTIGDTVRGVEMRPTRHVVDCCETYINGRWYCLPC